jgi:transposase
MPRTRPPYPPEFRAEAVELIRSGTKSFRELSRDLGVTDQTLRNWVRQADVDAGRRNDGLTTPDREEDDGRDESKVPGRVGFRVGR